MKWSTQLKTAATADPVSVVEAKAHLRVTDTADDNYIGTLIAAATQWAQTVTGRQLVTATWFWHGDGFPSQIVLPYPPLQSVTEITYYDSANALQVLSEDAYEVSTAYEPAVIQPVSGQAWPSTYSRQDAVRVEYVAGYGPAAAVPAGIKQAILLLVGHWYENREEVVAGVMGTLPVAADALLRQYWHGWEFQ